MKKLNYNHLDDCRIDAETELTELEAMKVLLSNNSLAAVIHIGQMRIGICKNDWLIPVIDNQIAEINKFLQGESNDWE